MQLTFLSVVIKFTFKIYLLHFQKNTNMDNMFTPEHNLTTFYSAGQVSTHAMTLQPIQNQLVELGLFRQDDNNYFMSHVNCYHILSL